MLIHSNNYVQHRQILFIYLFNFFGGDKLSIKKIIFKF